MSALDECLPIQGNQLTCSRGTGGCGVQHSPAMSDHKAIREALESQEYLTATVAKDDLLALLADLDAVRGALEECKRWHQGDKWRDGDSMQRAAWEGHLAFIDAALKGASHD